MRPSLSVRIHERERRIEVRRLLELLTACYGLKETVTWQEHIGEELDYLEIMIFCPSQSNLDSILNKKLFTNAYELSQADDFTK